MSNKSKEQHFANFALRALYNELRLWFFNNRYNLRRETYSDRVNAFITGSMTLLEFTSGISFQQKEAIEKVMAAFDSGNEHYHTLANALGLDSSALSKTDFYLGLINLLSDFNGKPTRVYNS